MQLFALGVFIGGVIGSVIIAILTSGSKADEDSAYARGYDAAMAEVEARHLLLERINAHKVRAAKAAKRRKGKA